MHVFCFLSVLMNSSRTLSDRGVIPNTAQLPALVHSVGFNAVTRVPYVAHYGTNPALFAIPPEPRSNRGLNLRQFSCSFLFIYILNEQFLVSLCRFMFYLQFDLSSWLPDWRGELLQKESPVSEGQDCNRISAYIRCSISKIRR